MPRATKNSKSKPYPKPNDSDSESDEDDDMSTPPHNNRRNTNNPLRIAQDPDDPRDPDQLNYAALHYHQQRLPAFNKPFIRDATDTYRWIIDVKSYQNRNPTIPEHMLYDKIVDSIRPQEQDLLNLYIQSHHDAFVNSVGTLKKWAKTQFPPSQSIESMKDRIDTLQHRKNENPMYTFNTWQIMVNTTNIIADEINAEQPNDAYHHKPEPITDDDLLDDTGIPDINEPSFDIKDAKIQQPEAREPIWI